MLSRIVPDYYNFQCLCNDFATKNNLILDWNSPIKEGDLYLAKGNVEFKLLTAKEIVGSFIVPVEKDYCYDIWQCVKVVDNPTS